REAIAGQEHRPASGARRQHCAEHVPDAGAGHGGTRRQQRVEGRAGRHWPVCCLGAIHGTPDRRVQSEGTAMTTPFRLPHQFASVDVGVRRELVDFAAADGYPLGAVLWLPPRGEPDLVVLAMHPRVDFSRHYLVPPLTRAGYAFFGASTRYLGSDADALHGRLLLDVGGAMAWLGARGFRRRVLLGNSGGGSLFAFYAAQASRPAAERLSRAPSGERVPLGEHDLPMADGLILLAAPPRPGQFLLAHRAPSV